MVMLRNIKFIPESTRKTRKASRTLHSALGSIEKAQKQEPLKFPKHMTVWRDPKSFKRRTQWYTVWREPNGRFAKKPEHGERARKLGLRDYSQKTKTPKT